MTISRNAPAVPALPAVTISDLHAHGDARGSLVVLETAHGSGRTPVPQQWNHVVSAANVLRGIHVHHERWDFLHLLDGVMSLALVDIRRDSAQFGVASVSELRASRPQRVCIPPGIAHGFLFTTDAVLLQGLSHPWDPNDELGCRWDAAGLNLPWQPEQPTLSQRDAQAGTFAAMVEAFHRMQVHGP